MTKQMTPFPSPVRRTRGTFSRVRGLAVPALFRSFAMALLAAICLAGQSSAAVTVDATSQQFGAIGTTSLTFSHTLGSGSNRLVVCGVQIANPTTAIANVTPTVTFGGVAMTAITGSQAPTHAESSTSKIESEMFYVNDSSLGTMTGPQTVDVELPSTPTGGVAANCTSFFDMAQAGPEVVGTAYSGTSVQPSITLTTATNGDLVIDSFAGGFTASTNPTKTASPNSGQTQLTDAQLSTAGIFSGSSYQIAATAGSVTMGWTETVSRQAYSAVAFAPTATVNYTVTASVSPTGSGTVALSPSALSYASGTSVQVTATPAPYYSFASFSGDLTSTTNPATVSVTANMNIVANFTQNMCNLTIVTAGQGSATPSTGSYPCGSTVNLTATADSGYNFASWSGNGFSSTSNSSGSFVLTGDTTETATFVAGAVCTLTTNVTGSGSVTLSPSGGSYSCGTQVQVTAVPSSGDWSFTGFSGDLSGTTNPQTITLNANSSVTAAFTQVNFPVNVTIVGPGTVTADPSATSYAQGTSVQLTATPDAGAYFVGFTGDLTSATSPASVTVDTTKNVTATFAYSLITQDAVSHAATTSASSILTWTHKLGSGTSRAVIIEVGSADSVASPDANAVVTGVYFNGVYATPIPGSLKYCGTSGMVQTQFFYLTDAELPAAGTYTVEVDTTGPIGGIQAGAISLFGVNQGPPEVVAVNSSCSGADLINSSITTLTNNAWVIDAVEDNDVTAMTADSGQTLAWSQSSSSVGTGGSSTEQVATAGTVTLGWAGSASRLVESLVDFAPSGTITPPTYTLYTSASTGGTVATNPGLSQLPTQTGVLITATPAVGYVFGNWSIDSATTSTVNPLPFVMDANHSVVANFTAVPTCTLNYTITGQGTVTPASGSSYNCGTAVTLTATPASGYSFTQWGGDFASADNPASYTLSTNSNLTVEFDPIPQCMLTMTTAGTGSVSPGSGSYACGSTVTIQATQSDPSWPFSGWSGDITDTANPATITLNGNMSITGNFVQGSTCTLTTSVTGSGAITPASGSAYLCGTQISVAAVPSAHYLFSGWGGALSGSTTPTTLMLSSSETVSATFDYNTTGVTGDTRTVVEPTYPAVCTVLTASQPVSHPTEVADTSTVQAALNACPAGEAVEFSASSDGTDNAFVIAPITLPAGVTMLVDPEVTILGSIKYADYSCNTSESWCTPLINVAPNSNPATGSGIMGLGVIDGRGGTTLSDKGESWWATGSDARPRLVYLSSHATGASSDYFTAYKITLKNSPKFHLSGVGNDLTVWGIKIYAPPDSPNTDGIDPSGSSNITITDSYISDGDDWISPKADSGHIANVTIENDHTYSGHGISIGSETNAGLNNMLVKNIDIDNGFGGSSYDSLRIKSDSSRGGEVYDVLYKNICIENGGDTIVIDPFYTSATGSLYPNFHDITFSNVTKLLHNSSYKSTMIGYSLGSINNPLSVTLDNVTFIGDAANDFKSPSNYYNVNFNFGPGPVSMAPYLTTDAATASNDITITDGISNTTESPYDCTGAFVYLAGDLTAPSAATTGTTGTATSGNPFTLTAVLQNVVSPLVNGTASYYQNNMPTGTIEIMEGTNVVGSATITSGSRLTSIIIPAASITTGQHTYTAYYEGDSHYAALSFGSFTLTVSNGTTLPIAPVASSQSVTVSYNTATPVTLSATGTGTMTYTVVANPANGTLSGTAPNLTYTPTANYTGADSFTFKANNGTDSNVATVTITISPAAPVASSQSVTVAYNTAMPVTLSASGSGTLTYSVVTNPAHGALSGTIPNLTYTPTSGYSGADSFTFKANNGTDSNVATVNITVAPAAPVAGNQSVTVAYNTATPVTLSATGSGTLTYTVVTNPANGTLSGSAPNLTYTPTSGYSGADSFTFKANNGTDSNVATVTITVSPAAPVASSQSVTTAYNTATAITLTATGSGTLTYSVVTNPAHGALSGTIPNLTYTPTSGYSGADSFTFKANNGTDSNVATVSITVQAQELLVWSPASGGSMSATVTAGQTAIYQLQIAGWVGANSQVTFSCTGVPVLATCTVSPSPATLNGAAEIPITITVSTQELSSRLNAVPIPGSKPGSGLPLTLAAGIAGCLFGLRKKVRNLRIRGLFALCGLIVSLGLATGCSHQSHSPDDTAVGTYHMTVTASSNGVSQNAALTLIVQ